MTALENKQDKPCKMGYEVAGPSEDKHINPYCSKWVSQEARRTGVMKVWVGHAENTIYGIHVVIV